MSGIYGISPKSLIILSELFSDLGNQFIQLSVLNLLFFKGENALVHLLFLCVMDQTPSILLGPFAGLWIDKVGGRSWLIWVTLFRILLAGTLIFRSCLWVLFPVYLCLITGSLFFNIGRLSLTPLLIPENQLISFNALNERVSLMGRIFGPWLIGTIILTTSERMWGPNHYFWSDRLC